MTMGNLSENFVDRLIEYRKGDDGILGTEDDQVFLNVDDIEAHLGMARGGIAALEDLRKVNPPAETAKKMGINEITLLGVTTDTFRIHLEAKMKYSPNVTKMTAVIERHRPAGNDNIQEGSKSPPPPYRVLYWNEN